MSNLAPTMKTETKRSSLALSYGVRFTFADGTVEQYSDVSWCSTSLGRFEQRVADWGRIRSAVGDQRNNFEPSIWSGLQILDDRGRWQIRDATSDIRGTVVELFYGGRRVSASDILPRYRGKVLGCNFKQGVMTFDEIGPPFLLDLRGQIPYGRMLLADHPELPDEAVGIQMALGAYGRHDSFAFGNLSKGDNDGQITPLYVGEYTEVNLLNQTITGSRFIFGPGRMKRIVHIYRDEVKAADNLWNQQSIWQEINGRMWTRVQFKTNQSTKTITADVDGYEYVGDGSGTVIEDRVDQIVHFLSQWVFPAEKYRTGLWLPTSTQVNPDLIIAIQNYLGKLRTPIGYRGGRYIEAAQGQSVAMSHLNEWTQSAEVKTLTTFLGELGFGADSFDDPGYIDEPWIRREYHELMSGPLTPTRMSVEAVKRLSGNASSSQALGSFTEHLNVVDQSATEEATDQVDCPWSPGHL